MSTGSWNTSAEINDFLELHTSLQVKRCLGLPDLGTVNTQDETQIETTTGTILGPAHGPAQSSHPCAIGLYAEEQDHHAGGASLSRGQELWQFRGRHLAPDH